MHFLIRETLSFNLMYVTACYPVGTTISKTSSLFTALLQHFNTAITSERCTYLVSPLFLINIILIIQFALEVRDSIDPVIHVYS